VGEKLRRGLRWRFVQNPFKVGSGTVFPPAGDEGCAEQGGAEEACPEAELAAWVGEVFAGDEAVGGFPDEGSDESEDHDGDGESDAAGAAAGLFLVLHDAEGAEDDAAGAVGDGLVAGGVFAGQGGEEVGGGRIAGECGVLMAGGQISVTRWGGEVQ
jgi:hypothetical protein